MNKSSLDVTALPFLGYLELSCNAEWCTCTNVLILGGWEGATSSAAGMQLVHTNLGEN